MIGLFLSIFIGLLLGLLGAGGSILTVPLFVYIVGMTPTMASYASLFVVGTTALLGAISYGKEKLIHIDIAIQFFAGSFLGVTVARKWILPAVPQILIDTQTLSLTKDHVIMLFFSILMMLAARSMMRKKNRSENQKSSEESFDKKGKRLSFFMKSFFVGITTGFVGAGGGFLIVPALVLFAGLSMKETVGTSLLIIGMNSLSGFLVSWFSVSQQSRPDLGYLLQFTTIAALGLWLGKKLSKAIPEHQLKMIFGIFVFCLGLVIFVQQVRSLYSH